MEDPKEPSLTETSDVHSDEEISSLIALNAERAQKIQSLVALNVEQVEQINLLSALDDERVKQIEALAATDAEHVEQISMLAALDVERVEKIHSFAALDLERVEQINSLAASDLERVEQINQLTALDVERIEKINSLLALDVDRVNTINRLMAELNDIRQATHQRVEQINSLAAANVERVEQINQLSALDVERLKKINALLAVDVDRVDTINRLMAELQDIKQTAHDGMVIQGRNLAFLDEPNFASAWELARIANAEGWPGGAPDVRWRARIALWAAEIGMKLDGDFVECGVHTGLFSLTICHALKFGQTKKNFYLFDTFNGIPLVGLEGQELSRAKDSNRDFYHNVFPIAQRNFAPFPNAHLIQGALPLSLSTAPLGQIAYLSIDLNNAPSELQVIEKLWDKVVPGAVILIDDYIWKTHEPQYKMWNEFTLSKAVAIAPLPTGQGLIVKPQA